MNNRDIESAEDTDLKRAIARAQELLNMEKNHDVPIGSGDTRHIVTLYTALKNKNK